MVSDKSIWVGGFVISQKHWKISRFMDKIMNLEIYLSLI